MARLPHWLKRSPATTSLPPGGLWPLFVLDPSGQLSAIKFDRELLETLGMGETRVTGGAPILGADERGWATAYLASDWAFRCLSLRAAKVGELLDAAQLRNVYTDKIIIEHPYLEAIASAYELYHQDYYFNYVTSLDIFGETYTELISGHPLGFSALSVPGGLRVLPALAIAPDIRQGKIVSYTFTSDEQTVVFRPDEIAYDFTYSPFSTLRGASLLAGAMNTVNLDLYVQRHNTVYFQNGARPGLLIAPKPGETFSQADYNQIVEWLEQNKGVSNFFKTLPINRPVDITMIEYPSLEDQKYLTDDQRQRICGRLGVPEALVNPGAATRELTGEERIDFHQNTIIPLAKRIAKFINLKILPFFDPAGAVRLELDEKMLAALVEDEVKQDEKYRNRYLNGQITHNEMRGALRMSLVPDNEDFYVLPIGHRLVARDALAQIIHQEAASPELGNPLNPLNPPGQGLIAQPPQPVPENERRDYVYYPPSLLGGNGQGSSPARALRAAEPPEGPDEDEDDDQRLLNDPALDELRDWRRVAMRRGQGKAVDFVAAALPGALASALRDNLSVAGDSRDALSEVFARAALWLDLARGEGGYEPGKAIQATRLEFEDAFEAMLAEARGGQLTRRRWSALARALIRRWGARAYLDGLIDGGVEAETAALDADDQAAINRLLAEQGEYVSGLGERLFSPQGIPDGEAEHKAEAWFNKSVMPFYNAGRLSADQNGLYVWHLGATEQHCVTCAAAHGQAHRLKSWLGRGLFPQSDLLECRGFLCDCKLLRSAGRPRGDLGAIPLLEEVEHALAGA